MIDALPAAPGWIARLRALGVLFAATLAAACASPSPAPPTASVPAAPPPSPAALTPAATPLVTGTPAPLTYATPAVILEPPVISPTPSATPPPVGVPPEALAILNPGPGSQVVSPIRVTGWGGPSLEQRLHVRLVGEDGQVLVDRLDYLQAIPDVPGPFAAQVPFDIPFVAETARLEVSVTSPIDRQLDHLSSLHLVLLGTGTALIYPALRGGEKLFISTPRANALVAGGTAIVSGAGWLDSDVSLIAEVHDGQGNTIGTVATPLSSAGIGQLGTFSAQIPYHIQYAQYGRIAVYEPDTSIPGIVHYSSVRVFLRP